MYASLHTGFAAIFVVSHRKSAVITTECVLLTVVNPLDNVF